MHRSVDHQVIRSPRLRQLLGHTQAQTAKHIARLARCSLKSVVKWSADSLLVDVTAASNDPDAGWSTPEDSVFALRASPRPVCVLLVEIGCMGMFGGFLVPSP